MSDFDTLKIVVVHPYRIEIEKYRHDKNIYRQLSIALTKDRVEQIINGINEAACNGAPWAVYDESDR